MLFIQHYTNIIPLTHFFINFINSSSKHVFNNTYLLWLRLGYLCLSLNIQQHLLHISQKLLWYGKIIPFLSKTSVHNHSFHFLPYVNVISDCNHYFIGQCFSNSASIPHNNSICQSKRKNSNHNYSQLYCSTTIK